MTTEELKRLAEALLKPGCPVDVTKVAAKVILELSKGGD